MKLEEYRSAVDAFTPDQGVKERLAARMAAPKPCKVLPFRRAAAVALAAALALVCLTAVAMAASPQLREAVLTFFRMEAAERLPDPVGSGEGPNITQTDIGGLVRVEYIQTDGYYEFWGDLLYRVEWNDDRTEIESMRFWEIRDGSPVETEVDLNTTAFAADWQGAHYEGSFLWSALDGGLQCQYLTWDNRVYDEAGETDWYVSPIPGRTDAVLLCLSQGSQLDYRCYPLLLHLDTGETENFLAGTGAEKQELAYDYEWSEDMRYAVITCSDGIYTGEHSWLCDVEGKTLTAIEDLAGLGADSAVFAGGDTLILRRSRINEEGIYTHVECFAYDLTTGQAVQTLESVPVYQKWEENSTGVLFTGRRYTVFIQADRTIRVVDLKTGEQTPVEGFAFAQEDSLMPSPSGTKMLYTAAQGEASGLGIGQLGVLDLERGSFYAFERQGGEELYESSMGWADDSRVAIRSHTADRQTYYIFLYEFA